MYKVKRFFAIYCYIGMVLDVTQLPTDKKIKTMCFFQYGSEPVLSMNRFQNCTGKQTKITLDFLFI